MPAQFSSYYSDAEVEAAVSEGRHREFVGGLWEEMGELQLAVLRSVGLKAGHTLLDVGCGALRGGRLFVSYLEPGHYYGIDLRPELIDAGFELEITAAGFADRLPRSNLIADGEFNAALFKRAFDFALAFSVFTHLPLNHVRLCLEQLAAVVRPGGKFVATFFERPAGDQSNKPQTHAPANITTYATQDPYHYSRADIEFACEGLPWRAIFLDDVIHPRGQKAACFERLAGPAAGPIAKDEIAALGGLAGAGDNCALPDPPGQNP